MLHDAAESGNLDLVKYLVEEKNLDVKAKSESGYTVLHSAAWNGNLEMVKYLIKNGADVNAKSESGRTVLHSAASGNLDLVKYLVEEKKLDVNAKEEVYGAKSKYSRTPANVARNQEIRDYLKSKMK